MGSLSGFRSLRVTTPDGLGIDAQLWGSALGPEIVFVHGMLQCHLCWSKQVASALAQKFRMVTYDFRGHGGSGQPLDPSYYNDSARFADELQAVIEAAGFKRPILVGWSFGTRIVADYLLKFGSDRLAGINFVAAAISPNPGHYGPGIKKLGQTRDTDFAKSIRGNREFLRTCFCKEPAREEFETMLAYNASVPREIRRWFGRPASDTESVQRLLGSLTVPVLISHGLADQVILPELSRWLGTVIPKAKLSFFQESGHAPFFEEADRFNGELEVFAAQTK